MTYLFKRPEEPRELSQDEIRSKVKAGSPVFCGACGLEIIINRITGLGENCICRPRNINTSVLSLRITDDRIVSDIFIVSDEDFDSEKYGPFNRNYKRYARWLEHKKRGHGT